VSQEMLLYNFGYGNLRHANA